MNTRELLKLGATRLEEGLGAGEIAARAVMERGGKLNEALEEGLVRARGGEPKLFPNLVGAEEFTGIE